MTLDEEGYLWVACWDGWCVRRYAPDGSVDREIRFPAAHVSSVAFGGSDLDDLYVTTAWHMVEDGRPGRPAARRRPVPLPPGRPRPAGEPFRGLIPAVRRPYPSMSARTAAACARPAVRPARTASGS